MKKFVKLFSFLFFFTFAILHLTGCPGPTTYTVAFDTKGGSEVASQVIESGKKAIRPADPTKEDSTFITWHLDSIEYDFSLPIVANITLEAVWVDSSFTVVFDSDGGSNVSSVEVDYNTTVDTPSDPTKVGYTFDGWYKETTLYNFNTPVTAPVTLKAKWIVNRYPVTFDSDGGSAISSMEVDYNTKATTPLDPTKVGYTFAGWYSGSTLYDFDTLITGPITLKAHWLINTYLVTFNSDGGIAISDQSITHNNLVSEPIPPTKEGYIFLDWYLGETVYNFGLPVTASIVLQAHWEEIMSLEDFIANVQTTNYEMNFLQIVDYKNSPMEYNTHRSIQKINDIVYIFEDSVQGDDRYLIAKIGWNHAYGITNGIEGQYFYDMDPIPPFYLSYALDPMKMVNRTGTYIYDIALSTDDLFTLTNRSDWSSYEYTLDLVNLQLHFYASKPGNTFEYRFTFDNFGAVSVTLPENIKPLIIDRWETALEQRTYQLAFVTETTKPSLVAYLDKYHLLWTSTNQLEDLLALFDESIMEMNSLALEIDQVKFMRSEANRSLQYIMDYLRQYSTDASMIEIETIAQEAIALINQSTTVSSIQIYFSNANNNMNNASILDNGKYLLFQTKNTSLFMISRFLEQYYDFITYSDYLNMKTVVNGYREQIQSATTVEEVETIFTAFQVAMNELPYALKGGALDSFKERTIQQLVNVYQELTLQDFDVPSYYQRIVQEIQNGNEATIMIKALEFTNTIEWWKLKQDYLNQLYDHFLQYKDSATDESLLIMQQILDTAKSAIMDANRYDSIDVSQYINEINDAYVYSELNEHRSIVLRQIKMFYDDQYLISSTTSQDAMEEVYNQYVQLLSQCTTINDLDVTKTNFNEALLAVSEVDSRKTEMVKNLQDFRYYLTQLNDFILDDDAFDSLLNDYQALDTSFKNGEAIEVMEQAYQALLLKAGQLVIDEEAYHNYLVSAIQSNYDVTQEPFLSLYEQMLVDLGSATNSYLKYQIVHTINDQFSIYYNRQIAIVSIMNRQNELLFSASIESAVLIHSIFLDYQTQINNATLYEQMFQLTTTAIQAMEAAHVYSPIEEFRNMSLNELDAYYKNEKILAAESCYAAMEEVLNSYKEYFLLAQTKEEMTNLKSLFTADLAAVLVIDPIRVALQDEIAYLNQFQNSLFLHNDYYGYLNLKNELVAIENAFKEIATIDDLQQARDNYITHANALSVNVTTYKSYLQQNIELYVSSDEVSQNIYQQMLLTWQETTTLEAWFRAYYQAKKAIVIEPQRFAYQQSLLQSYNNYLSTATDESALFLKEIYDESLAQINQATTVVEIQEIYSNAGEAFQNAYVASELKLQQKMTVAAFEQDYYQLLDQSTEVSFAPMEQVYNQYIQSIYACETLSEIFEIIPSFLPSLQAVSVYDASRAAMSLKLNNLLSFYYDINIYATDFNAWQLAKDNLDDVYSDFRSYQSLSVVDLSWQNSVNDARGLEVRMEEFKQSLKNRITSRYDVTEPSLDAIYSVMLIDFDNTLIAYDLYQVYEEAVKAIGLQWRKNDVLTSLGQSRDSLLNQILDEVKRGKIWDVYNTYETQINNATSSDEALSLFSNGIQDLYRAAGNVVIFDSNGGSEVPPIEVPYDSILTRPADPTRDGYAFVGWYNGLDQYNFYSPVREPLILQAVWVAV